MLLAPVVVILLLLVCGPTGPAISADVLLVEPPALAATLEKSLCAPAFREAVMYA
ncbi:hypothetical protein GPECTOR_1285g535 [Gonium pectorale]|uniref:Uncharacterized protein n=1 Tax=Gonium pectorale TaxID=33097 RepID=A0A150FTL1_GONPE|nr:hypothetical protein GPECTOR_1285g535 [Gonium pectorale]|eukprot:KXZ40926.1 hypothetical protein GPECTOR_1285g535 [Gonium pectorale]